MSPLNLSPGLPTQLDDAYPVPEGDWLWQTGVSWRFRTAMDRLTMPFDVRYGLARGFELSLGSQLWTRGAVDGEVVDPRAVRVSLLSRLTRQEPDGAWPSLALRTTFEAPYAGIADSPSWRGDLLASWRVGTTHWIHANASYLARPEPQTHVLTPARQTWWQWRLGWVHPLDRSVSLVIDGGLQQDPLTSSRRLAGMAEGALLVELAPEWVLSLSAEHLTSTLPMTQVLLGVQVGW
jgi:hypothetical protein